MTSAGDPFSSRSCFFGSIFEDGLQVLEVEEDRTSQCVHNIIYSLSVLIAKGTAIGSHPSDRERNTRELKDGSSDSMLKAIACLPLSSALEHLNSNIDGLSSSEAASRLKNFGPNVLTSTKPPSWWKMLLMILPNPFNVLLAFIAIISVVTPDRNWVCLQTSFRLGSNTN